MPALTTVHPFEEAGLGVAPFRCTGHSVAKYQACHGAPIQPGASCDYCGTGIVDVFHVRSSDGRAFKVGCDCVRRVFAKFDGSIPPEFRHEIAAMEREKREAKRVAAWNRLTARRDQALATLATHSSLFLNEPHPNEYYASTGKTRRDYLDWMLKSHSTTSRTAACKLVEERCP